jgi:hypothetical protein
MRNDARPIGEEFRDIAQHDEREPVDGAKASDPAEGSRDAVNLEKPLDDGNRDSPFPSARSAR